MYFLTEKDYILIKIFSKFVARCPFNTLRPRHNGRRFADYTFKHIFLNENDRIPIEISLKFVAKGPINNIPVLIQIMAWRRPGDKPLSAPTMVSLLTHICVTRPQWVNWSPPSAAYMSVNWVSNCSDNGLSQVRRQAIPWTNADLLPFEPLGTNFSEIWIEILKFSFKKMCLKMPSAKMSAILSKGKWVDKSVFSSGHGWLPYRLQVITRINVN